MVLNKYRKTGDRLFGPAAERLKGVNPNHITWWSVICAFLAGLCFALGHWWPLTVLDRTFHWFLVLGVVGVALNSFLDALDGKVARISGRESARGDFLDHVMDRVSDVLILGGIMFSAFCDVTIGALAIIVTLMVSYMGTQAQAVGVGRNYGGVMGRAERMVMLMAFPIVQTLYNGNHPDGVIPYIDLTFLEVMMVVLIFTGIATVVHRGLASWKELGEVQRGGNRKGAGPGEGSGRKGADGSGKGTRRRSGGKRGRGKKGGGTRVDGSEGGEPVKKEDAGGGKRGGGRGGEPRGDR